MSTEQLTGLQLAIALLAQIGNDDSDRAIAAVHDLAEAHDQRLTLQHHAADQVWRIADLEVKCVTLKELHDAATDERDALRDRLRALNQQFDHVAEMRCQVTGERDALRAELDCAKGAADVAACSLVSEDCAGYECVGSYIRAVTQQLAKERDDLRAKYDELLVALHGIGAALGIPEGDRSPYSVTCGVLERVNRLAEIEAQEPLFYYRPIKGGSMYEGPHWAKSVGGQMLREEKPGEWKPLYARPVPAQAVPDEHAVRTGFRSYDGSGWAATATPWQIWRDAVKWAGGHSTAPEHKA